VIKIYYLRITKYNPDNRDKNGFYSKDEWSSIGDVGKRFGGKEFTLDEYLCYEERYLGAIIDIMRENNVESLRVESLEKSNYVNHSDFYEPATKEYFESIKENMLIPKQKIPQVAKFVLREMIWCKLVSDKMFLHFGYDYYMYIGSKQLADETLQSIVSNSLFVESMVSPYL